MYPVYVLMAMLFFYCNVCSTESFYFAHDLDA